MNYINEITKKLDNFCSINGLQHSQYFDKFLDDVLYTFGKPVGEKHIPDQKTGDFLFDLSSLYAKAVINSEPYTDILGIIYMELGSKYKRSGLGQFFTPQPICELMASLTMGNPIHDDNKYISINEPCVGAGAMLLAVLKLHKVNYKTPLNRIAISCNDLDIMCCKMATAQIMSNLLIHQDNLASIVTWHGNTLGSPDDWNLFYGAETQEYRDYRISNPQLIIKPQNNYQQLTLF